MMRRRFLRQAAHAVTLPFIARIAMAQVAPPPQSSEQPTRHLAEQLAAYADGLRYDDLDAKTIERVKAHLIDTLGCGIAAFDERPVRICRDVALAVGNGGSTVIGTSHRTTPDLASFANGAAFRYYDLNDVYVGRTACHPSDNIAACLAVAEAEGARASDLVTAIVLAYEVNCRLVDAFDVTARGWDGATVFSLPAVALAAGKLMKLSPQQLAQALSLALNDHIPMGKRGRRRSRTGRDSPMPKPLEMACSRPCSREEVSAGQHLSLKDAEASSSWCRVRQTLMSTLSVDAALPTRSMNAE
jgi:2-methylcitrate dehydratase